MAGLRRDAGINGCAQGTGRCLKTAPPAAIENRDLQNQSFELAMIFQMRRLPGELYTMARRLLYWG
jgi:hypothetical protein